MKQRLDLLLVDRNLAETRSKAQALIMAGLVMVGGQKALKAGQLFESEIPISVKAVSNYVSRGGDKLASVAEALNLNFKDKTVLDVGSSTGGFTDFVIQQGAKKVYSVDVGNSQLHYRLRIDERVLVMERTDIREAILPELADVALIDVSFISLKKVLPAVLRLLHSGSQVIAMAKPQFEADKATADKYKGVIADESVRQQVLSELELSMKEMGFNLLSSRDSGVIGPKGNRERFYVLEHTTGEAS
jgi:23S rRNA (cytidine1920-2'-O)/16S rRNA (cytidine1409-2'-O)-methyltransferase